jgi:galactose mutarotase-like enzyme
MSQRLISFWEDNGGNGFTVSSILLPFLDVTIKGKGGRVYQYRSAFAMEPQHYPDLPNHPNFPSVELKPGAVYRNTISYRFSVK